MWLRPLKSSDNFIAYYRVSTARQGQSGLGLDAQRAAVAAFVASRSQLVAELTEVESGRKNDRPQLAAALDLCRRKRAVLVIAKLDRLARNVAFISNLMESGVEFVACDMPQANRLTLHILAAVAEHECEMISQRTRAALAVAKARGVRLGNPSPDLAKASAAASDRARAFRGKVAPLVCQLAADGELSLRAIAGELNARGVCTLNGRRRLPRRCATSWPSRHEHPPQLRPSGDLKMPSYQVALSFAGEQRPYVERVARSLQAKGIKVFYDRNEQFVLWGKDGVEFFHQLFSADTGYVVMFASREYADKKWTRHERRSALSRAISEESEYILLVRFDDTPLPGIPDTLMYLSADKFTPEALAAGICEKMGFSPFAGKASDVPSPHMTSSTGEAVFDYGSFNGRYSIGDGVQMFETRWSKASDTSIHVMNDPPSIHGLAIALKANNISDIKDASIYDFTSYARTPRTGEIVVFRNTHGFYAAVKILDIKDRTRQDDRDELRFEYVIQTNNTASFIDDVG